MRGRSIVLAVVVLALAGCGGSDVKTESSAADSVPGAPAAAVDSATPVAVDPAVPADRWQLGETGIGPLRVGMTVAEAVAALPDGGTHPETQECAYVGLSGLPAGVTLMTEAGRIVRVDADDSSSVKTAKGVGVGSTEQQVLAAYPGARTQPHKYEDGHYLIVMPNAPADTTHRIVFETVAGLVKRFRGGVIPAVEYVEGCS